MSRAMRPWEQPPGTYAGIGSRKTPEAVAGLMELVAARLARLGWILRTGGAEGADFEFEVGARVVSEDAVELFLPWPSFAERARDGAALPPKTWTTPTLLAYQIAERHHPAWVSMTRGPRALHARNVHQVLGEHCDDPAAFVLCWTPDGATTEPTAKTGGTGQALRIAKAYDVPVYNLARPDHLAIWSGWR